MYLQEHLHTVDLEDADIAHLADDLSRWEKFDPACAGTKSYITNYINRLKPNKVFSADTFVTDTISADAARMALERMVSEGKIRKFGKGRYYRPE